MRLLQQIKFFNSKELPLVELDDIYAKAISHLPLSTRLEYCNRLISRSKFDFDHVSCREKRKQLKTLIKSTLTEISKLKHESRY